MYPITFPMITPKMTRTQYLTVASTASITSSHDDSRGKADFISNEWQITVWGTPKEVGRHLLAGAARFASFEFCFNYLCIEYIATIIQKAFK